MMYIEQKWLVSGCTQDIPRGPEVQSRTGILTISIDSWTEQQEPCLISLELCFALRRS